MLYYLLFWTILGFIFHFYIIFGTNLLTGGPAQNCCFLPISLFRRNGISNGVQTEQTFLERDFLPEYDPGDLDPTPRKLRGGHEVGGRALGGAPHPRDRLFCSLEQGPSLLDHVRWENHVSEDFIPFGLRFDILFIRNTEIGKKTAILGWASG